jgi:predicted naringenin-chalcone synthase
MRFAKLMTRKSADCVYGTVHAAFSARITMDSIASSLLFGDGAAAVLVTGDAKPLPGLHLEIFMRKSCRKANGHGLGAFVYRLFDDAERLCARPD